MTDQGKKAVKAGKQSKILHAGFELGILLKGLHALSEIVGGALIWFVSPASIGHLVRLLTQNELVEDPQDLLANIMARASERYSIGAQHFGALYLLSHGIINILVVLLLWRKRLWAYAIAIVTLVLFIVFQTARWTTTHSAFLVAFTLLDIFMIWFTVAEYRRGRQEQ